MLEGLPNAAFTFGYVNASWTLKADLVSEYVCRLLNYMAEHGYDTVVPQTPGDDVERLPFTEMSSGYFGRAMNLLPRGGSRGPWQIRHNYLWDQRPPAEQHRRSGPALHQTPCDGARFSLIGSLLDQTVLR